MDPYILQGISGVNCSMGILRYPAGIHHLIHWSWRIYHSCLSLPSASAKSVLLSYPVAPHTMVPGVWEVYASIISASNDFHQVNYGHVCVDLTATNRSKTHRWTPQNATQCSGWLWLYNMQVFVFCGILLAVNNAWQVEISTKLTVICSRRFVMTPCLNPCPDFSCCQSSIRQSQSQDRD